MSMASLINHQFFIVLLSILCDPASSLMFGLSKSLDPSKREANSIPNGTRELQNDIVFALSALVDQRNQYLHLLYDVKFEDDVYDVTRFYKNKSGMMVYLFDGSDVQLVDILTPVEGPTILLILCRPQQVTDMFRKIRRRRLKSHYVMWLVILRSEEEKDIVTNGLEGLVLEGTKVILLIKNEDDYYHIYSSQVDMEGVMRFFYEDKLDLSSSRGKASFSYLAFRDDSSLYRNMRGREMRIAAVNNFGICNLRQLPDGTTYPSTGIDASMIKTLSYALNFTIRIVNPPDGAYGNPLPNGTVTGMIGMVVRGDADFAICSISLTALRKTVVDFPYPYHRARLGLFSRAPKQTSRVLAIFSPFSVQVWFCIIAAVFIMGPIVAIQSLVSSTYMKVQKKQEFHMYSFNMYRSFVTQGNRLPATSNSLRVAFISWYMFSLIVSVLYSGMLTAVLAIPTFEVPIDYLLDLPRAVEQGFDVGVLKDSANHNLFKEAKDGIYADTWKLFNHRNPEKSFVRGNAFAMDRVFTRDFVYIGFTASCEILSTKLGRSKIHIGRETFFSHDIGLVTPPGAPYTETFGDITRRFIEAGLRTKWKSDELSRLSSSVPKEKEASGTYAITIEHLQAAFFLVLIGFLVAALVLIAEITFHSCSSEKFS